MRGGETRAATKGMYGWYAYLIEGKHGSRSVARATSQSGLGEMHRERRVVAQCRVERENERKIEENSAQNLKGGMLSSSYTCIGTVLSKSTRKYASVSPVFPRIKVNALITRLSGPTVRLESEQSSSSSVAPFGNRLKCM